MAKRKNKYEMTDYDREHYIQNSLFNIEIKVVPSEWYKNKDMNKNIYGIVTKGE